MQDQLGLCEPDATAAIAFGVLPYTIALLVGTAFSAWFLDRLQCRKVFVAGSTMLLAVDQALVVDVADHLLAS